MDPDSVAAFNEHQIREILASTADVQNPAWATSLLTATNAMEKGIYARLFAKSAAAAVLKNAMTARQREGEAANRWYIACLAESLATLRLLGLKYPSLRERYLLAKSTVFESLPPPL